MKELTKIKVDFVVVFTLILIGMTIVSLESNLFYNEISDPQSLKNIELEERKNLKIPNDVIIHFIFDVNMNKSKNGYVDLKKSNHNKYFIYLKKPVLSSTVRHEIYHVYRFNKLYPLFWSPEWQKRIGLLAAINIMSKEQFLAYIYGWFGINLEL